MPAGPAHVVQRVVGQQAQRPAVERLDREKRDLGIDGPGRLQQIGAVARIHLGLVRFAEGVEQLGARLQQPPPAEHLPRQVDGAPGDTCRLEVVDRATHSVGNPMGHEPLVLGEFLLGLERILPSGTHRRVRMRAGHEHPIRRQPGRLGHLPFGLVQHFAADIDVVADDQRDPRGAVVQDEAPRVQFVVDVLGRRRSAEVAHQPIAQPRGDIAGGRPGQQRLLLGRLGGGRGCQENNRRQEQECESVHACFSLMCFSFSLHSGHTPCAAPTGRPPFNLSMLAALVPVSSRSDS